MDAPAHESMEDLVDYAHDIDRWSIRTNAILDPKRLRATNYYRQDQDRGPQSDAAALPLRALEMPPLSETSINKLAAHFNVDRAR
jgi:hypothetical protein